MDNCELLKDDFETYMRRLEGNEKANEVIQHIISEYIKQISLSEQNFEIPVEPFLIEEEMEQFNGDINNSVDSDEICKEITEIMNKQYENILGCLREYTSRNYKIISSEKVVLLVRFVEKKIVIDFKKSYIPITIKFY